MLRFNKKLLIVFALAMASCSKPVEDELEKPVADFMKNIYKEDHSVGAVEIIDKTEKNIIAQAHVKLWLGTELLQEDIRFVYLENKDGRWVAKYDLQKDFEKRVFMNEEVEHALLERLGQRIMERFRVDVKIQEGLKKEYRISRDQNTIAGYFQARFSYPTGPDQHKNCLYIEIYKFREGRWRYENYSLQEELPTPRRF